MDIIFVFLKNKCRIIYVEKRIFIKMKDHDLPMVITESESDSSSLCILMLHGFMAFKEGDGYLFSKFAQKFEENGISSAIIDFCSMGENRFSRENYGLKVMLEEVKEAFRYLKEECGFSHIVLLGHSLGGRIAVYSSDLPVSCLITINGALQDGKDLSDLLVPEMKDGYCLVRPSDGRVELLFERFKKELVEIQKEVILNYEGPILVCIGKDDPTIDPAISYRFSLENKTDRFEIEGANHTLNAKTGDYAKVYECIDYVMKWIKEKGLL